LLLNQPSPAAETPGRPNLLVLLCDDLGYGDLGCFGHPDIQTPHLDQLAAEGLHLTDCYAAAPVCSPSRAGLLTGRSPDRCGIYDWIPAGSPVHVRREEVTVATLLQRAGYQTCHAGKWHCNGRFNSADQPQPGNHGFDHWFATQNNAHPSHENPDNFVRDGRPVGPLQGHSSALIVQEAVDWLNRRDPARPFGLFVWFHAPHEPVATSEEFVRRYPGADPMDRAVYYGNVTQTDHEIGRLLSAVDGLGVRDRTLVWFTSDNGPETLNRYRGAHRSYGSPGPLRGMKLHLSEGGIRVPGILRWPGHTSPGTTSAEPVCGLDLLPTMCDLLSLPLPPQRAIDGASFLPLLDGRPIDRRVPLHWHYSRALGHHQAALRDGPWKLLADAALQRFELYHLPDDPGETTDLAAREPDRLRVLAARLTALHREVEAEGPAWPGWDRDRNAPA
jgi:arylsulfatase A